MPQEFFGSSWKSQYIAKGIYKITPEEGTTKGYIPQTGSEITTKLQIDFPHRFIRTSFYHTNSSNVAVATQQSIEISRPATSFSPSGFKDFLHTNERMLCEHEDIRYGERWEYESTTWDIKTNSTNTDRIWIVIYIQKIGDN